MIAAKLVWQNGRKVLLAEATTHITSYGLHYGVGVFEGIRCYQQLDGGAALFRLDDHVRRLFDSARICDLTVPFTFDDLTTACREIVAANGFQEAYVRPMIWKGVGSLGLGATDNAIDVAVLAWPWAPPLGAAAQEEGLRAITSSFVRGHPGSVMSKAKITGQYVLSALAKQEASRTGHDDAILLDTQGRVAEAVAENVFAVIGGRLLTPPLDLPILAGITRATVITLAQEMGLTVTEQAFTRDALLCAQEIFLTGTANEITPVRELDGRPIGTGRPGPIATRIRDAFRATVCGQDTRHGDWRARV